MSSRSFHPPVRTLMGPGPSDVNPRILSAMARPTIGHLDPVFVDLMSEMKDLLRYAFQTGYELTMPVSAPGSAGMETCFVNLVQPGDKVIVCQNGVFGGRMKENVERCGGTAVMVQDDWGRAVDPQKVEEALKANPDAGFVSVFSLLTYEPIGIALPAEDTQFINWTENFLQRMKGTKGLDELARHWFGKFARK